MSQPADRDLRHVEGTAASHEIYLEDGDRLERVRVIRPSASGCFVATVRLKRPGDVIQLQFRMIEGEDPVVVRAIVVRRVDLSAAEPGMGVVWIDARSRGVIGPLRSFLRVVVGFGPSALAAIDQPAYVFNAAQRLVAGAEGGEAASVDAARRAPTPVSGVPMPPAAAVATPPVERAPTSVVGFRDALASAATESVDVVPDLPDAPRPLTPGVSVQLGQ